MLSDPEGPARVETASAAAEIERDDLGAAGEMVGHRIPDPRVRRDAVDGDERRGAQQSGPPQRRPST